MDNRRRQQLLLRRQLFRESVCLRPRSKKEKRRRKKDNKKESHSLCKRSDTNHNQSRSCRALPKARCHGVRQRPSLGRENSNSNKHSNTPQQKKERKRLSFQNKKQKNTRAHAHNRLCTSRTSCTRRLSSVLGRVGFAAGSERRKSESDGVFFVLLE